MIQGPPITIPEMSLLDMLQQTATLHGDTDAVLIDGLRYTYTSLWEHVRRLMAHLQSLGIQAGQRIGILLPNSPEYVIAFYATVGIGAVVVNLNPLGTESELTFMLEDSSCTLVLTQSETMPAVPAAMVTNGRVRVTVIQSRNEASERSGNAYNAFYSWFHFEEIDETERSLASTEWGSIDPNVVAVLQYTGGTTGRPKGAMLTHRNLVSNAYQFSTVLANLVTGDICVCALPLYHVFSMTCCMNVSVLKGLTVLMVQRFDPTRMVELFHRHQPAYFPGVPTMHLALLQRAEEHANLFDSLKVLISGGASLPMSVIQSYEQSIGRAPIEGFGMTETSPVTCFNQGPKGYKPGSIGMPIAGTDLKIVSLEDGWTECAAGAIGELVVRGPQVMQGYWNRPDETVIALRDGWLFTGDVAQVDEDGYAFIVDRKKDLIITGGFNVYPREVEEVLYRHPGIFEAAVVGVPDEYFGETVKAFIVVQAEWDLSTDDVINWCRAQLSGYKVPRDIQFRESLPKSGVGKILRQSLRR